MAFQVFPLPDGVAKPVPKDRPTGTQRPVPKIDPANTFQVIQKPFLGLRNESPSPAASMFESVIRRPVEKRSKKDEDDDKMAEEESRNVKYRSTPSTASPSPSPFPYAPSRSRDSAASSLPWISEMEE